MRPKRLIIKNIKTKAVSVDAFNILTIKLCKNFLLPNMRYIVVVCIPGHLEKGFGISFSKEIIANG